MTRFPPRLIPIKCAIVLAVSVAICSISQAAPEAREAFKTSATLVAADGRTRAIELLAFDHDAIRYRVPDEMGGVQGLMLKDGVTVFVPEPEDYTAAMELYRARNYRDARKKFAAVKDRFQPIERLPDSTSTSPPITRWNACANWVISTG